MSSDAASAAARFRRGMGATLLTFEALVVLFAVLVAKNDEDLSTRAVLVVGVGGALACLLVAGLLRHRWALLLGSLLQVGLVLTGLVVPVMWALGGLFAALWFGMLYLARRVEALRRAQEGPAGG